MSKLTENEKLERREKRRLETRVRWASDVLTQTGFQEWGTSETNGLSCYFILKGSELTDAEAVRIRVSDHYAHSFRYMDDGRQVVVFDVRVDTVSTRRQIEKATRQAIEDLNSFLQSDEFKELCKQRAEELDCG